MSHRPSRRRHAGSRGTSPPAAVTGPCPQRVPGPIAGDTGNPGPHKRFGKRFDSGCAATPAGTEAYSCPCPAVRARCPGAFVFSGLFGDNPVWTVLAAIGFIGGIVLLFRPAIRLDRGHAKAWLSLFENCFVMTSGGTLLAARWEFLDEVRQNVATSSTSSGTSCLAEPRCRARA